VGAYQSRPDIDVELLIEGDFLALDLSGDALQTVRERLVPLRTGSSAGSCSGVSGRDGSSQVVRSGFAPPNHTGARVASRRQ
jgi:hypothetical protein